MTAAYSPALDRRLAAFSETPVGFVIPGQQSFLSNCPRTLPVPNFDYKDQRYPPFGDTLGRGATMDAVQLASYSAYVVEKPVLETGMGPAASGGSGAAPYQLPDPVFDESLDALPSPYDSVPPPPPVAEPNDQRGLTPSPYTRDSFRQSKDDSGILTDVRSAVDTPVDAPSESSATPGRQSPYMHNAFDGGRPFPSTPRHLSISLAGASNGISPRPDSQYTPIIPSSAAPPSYKPSAIPISANTRAVAQQPTYITPPSSPRAIAVNPIYNYAPTPYVPEAAQTAQTRMPAGVYAQQPYRPAGLKGPEGREICVECAMRDEDMADVDVTSPGVWDRESDVFYHELCRQEVEEAEERNRARTSNSSAESHLVVRSIDPTRPRARGNRLTEQNIKLWLTMNPREPQARQQTIDLYIKTQTALLEAEALARARALQESRLLESKLKDTYDNLRRSTFDASPSGFTGEEGGVRLKTSHISKRSVSGPSPISLSPVVVDGSSHVRNQSQSREVTLLENGMIVEHVDVRKEEKERRREERRERERERERSRARKSSRGSGVGAEVMSIYSTQSPLPHQMDNGFYTAASNGSGAILRDRERPMSLSQSSTLAMSMMTMPIPLTPPAGSNGFGAGRPPNARVHSQVSLVDSQSISSASMGANRRSRFFAFRNWSEAWKSRESFAPSAVMSVSGSMMDMHLALDREKQSMQMRPPTVDLGSNAPSVLCSEQFPRRASFSMDRKGSPTVNGDRPKKKKGLAKIWGMVTGNKYAKADAQRRDSQSIDRSEDDSPLAPPPPLSYLVNRTSRERSMSSSTRRTSMPTAIPSTPAPSAALPTPTSIRNPWQEQDGARPTSHVLTAHAEESYNNGYLGVDSLDPSKGVHPALSEPDMRQRVQDIPMPAMRMPSSPRPISVLSLHKSLPPLPNEASASQSMPSPLDSPRPQTMYDLNSPMTKAGPDALESPQPPFRRDVRRQSFAGMSSRPDMPAASTFPVNGRNGVRSTLAISQDEYAYSPYAELGSSAVPASRSLGRLGLSVDDASSDKALGKRRSRFGLAGLLGKMSGASRSSEARLSVSPAPGRDAEMLLSDSDTHLDGSPSGTEYGGGGIVGGGSSRSRHTGVVPPSRMSVASRRAIEELVDQDPNFVAYRYPSVDQNIALLR